MKPTQIRHTLDQLWKTPWPAFIWGPPGVGKSAVVTQLAAERGLPVIDIRAPLLDPTDLRGIPAVVGDRAEWFAPSFLPRADAKPGVLFFDELSAAPPLVQASLYQLVLDRRVGDYTLPDGWKIVAAGNREQDRSVVFRMPDALANRFVHLQFETDFEDRRRWAIGRGLHPSVVAFLSLRCELLHAPSGGAHGFATPRSWEVVADILTAFDDDKLIDDAIAGTVGKAAAVEFATFRRSSIAAEEVAAICADPMGHPLPKSASGLYVLVSLLAHGAHEERLRNIDGQLLSRLPVEFGVTLAKDILRKFPPFVRSEELKAFAARHKEAFA
ncbi:MAG: ATP-binding protein [Phycisphaerales bacterium]